MSNCAQEIINFLILNEKRKLGKRLYQVGIQLHFVSYGIKPGFLFDFGSNDIIWITNLINSLANKKLIHSNVIVKQINNEIFILNIKSMKLLKMPLFVDVTKNLNSPKIIDVNKNESINSMCQWLKMNLTDIESDWNNLSDTICLSSVIGYFIGYPVVYWLDVKISDDNCLGNTKIRVFQSFYNGILLSSFSVPKVVFENCDVSERLKNWTENQVSCGLEVKSFDTEQNIVIM